MLFSAGPVDVHQFADVDAVLVAFYPGEFAGSAVTETLLGVSEIQIHGPMRDVIVL